MCATDRISLLFRGFGSKTVLFQNRPDSWTLGHRALPGSLAREASTNALIAALRSKVLRCGLANNERGGSRVLVCPLLSVSLEGIRSAERLKPLPQRGAGRAAVCAHSHALKKFPPRRGVPYHFRDEHTTRKSSGMSAKTAFSRFSDCTQTLGGQENDACRGCKDIARCAPPSAASTSAFQTQRQYGHVRARRPSARAQNRSCALPARTLLEKTLRCYRLRDLAACLRAASVNEGSESALQRSVSPVAGQGSLCLKAAV